MTISFKDLLSRASANGGQNFNELEGEKVKLTVEVGELDAQLAARRVRLREVEGLLAAPLTAAVRAAEVLGVELPDEFKSAAPQVKNAEGRKPSAGSYLWEPGPLPGSNRSEDLTPLTAELSRGLWRFSRGSGGSAGKDGVLTVAEFKGLLQAQAGSELQPGESATLKFANGRVVKISRLAAEK